MTGIPSEAYTRDRPAGDGPGPAPQASTLSNPSPWFSNWSGGNPGGLPGPVVNEQTALTYLAVYSCVSLIAETIGTLPLVTYRRQGRGKDRARNAYEYGILADEWNPKMTSPVARETLTGHLLTWGNEYAQIVRNRSGSRVLQLNPLGPDCVDPRPDARGEIVYDVYQRGTRELIATLPAADMIHVPGLGFDGVSGYSPIRVARSAIRAGMAQDQEAENFINRGIRPPGAIKFPAGKKFPTEAAAIEFRDRFRRIHASRDSSQNILVLEDGTEWMQLGIDPESAQLLESRQYSGTQICGLYRVPPHMVGFVEKQTSWGTGIGEQVDGFVKFSLLRWLVKKDKEYSRKVFGAGSDLFCEHLLEGLERADIAKRTAALKEQVMAGIRSPNEWREIENLNPREGGDVWFYPLNMGRTDAAGEDIAPPTPPAPPAAPKPGPAPATPPANDQAAAKLRAAIVAAAGRCLRKEAAEAAKAAARGGNFVAWVEEWYSRHADMVSEHCGPLADVWALTHGGAADYPARHVARSKADLLAAADGPAAGFVGRVERACEKWTGQRLADIAAEFQRG